MATECKVVQLPLAGRPAVGLFVMSFGELRGNSRWWHWCFALKAERGMPAEFCLGTPLGMESKRWVLLHELKRSQSKDLCLVSQWAWNYRALSSGCSVGGLTPREAKWKCQDCEVAVMENPAIRLFWLGQVGLEWWTDISVDFVKALPLHSHLITPTQSEYYSLGPSAT